MRYRRIHLRNNHWLVVHLLHNKEFRYLDAYTGYRAYCVDRKRAQDLIQEHR